MFSRTHRFHWNFIIFFRFKIWNLNLNLCRFESDRKTKKIDRKENEKERKLDGEAFGRNGISWDHVMIQFLMYFLRTELRIYDNSNFVSIYFLCVKSITLIWNEVSMDGWWYPIDIEMSFLRLYLFRNLLWTHRQHYFTLLYDCILWKSKHEAKKNTTKFPIIVNLIAKSLIFLLRPFGFSIHLKLTLLDWLVDW